jgi:hypothetical protein
MAKEARALRDQAEAPDGPVSEVVTYTPGPMDPTSVKWCGHTFQANVPKDIVGHAEGTDREKLNFQLIQSARDNRHFRVGTGKGPRRDAFTLPKTAEEYRGYMVGWLKDPELEHADQLIARFARDRDLQAACEVGADDYAYLSSLFMPKLHDLARGDELNEPQVAALWISHGINQLPW